MTKKEIIRLLKQNNVELRDCVNSYEMIFSFLNAIYKTPDLTYEQLQTSLGLILEQIEKINTKLPENIITRSAEIFES